jgi:DNA-directed RNA polymerase subunit E'/Rpb7
MNTDINDMTNTDSVYKDIELELSCSIKAHELSKYKTHLLNNLKKIYENKCYSDRGYISNIYSIKSVPRGYLINEDFSANIHYKITCYCSIWRPIINKIIPCTVKAINAKKLMYVEYGPMHIYIVLEAGYYNKTNFIVDEYKDILYAKVDKSDENKVYGVPIVEKSYVNVKILRYQIPENRQDIFALGFLDSLANETDIQMYNTSLNKFNKKE